MALVDPKKLVWAACPYFTWGEFTGWEHADQVRLARLQQLVRELLCPLRRAIGPITPSLGGWYFSRHGVARDGAHGEGVAVDFVPSATSLEAAYTWLRDHTRYGELLLERDHVHVTLFPFGGTMQALIEQSDGSFATDPDAPGDRAVIVEAGLHTAGAALLLAGVAVGLWREQERS